MNTFTRSKTIAAFALGLTLSACSTGEQLNRGYMLDERALEQIKIGSSAEQVILVLGTPSTVSTVGGQTYYYVSQKTYRRVQFMSENITDQKVLAIYLNKANKVERIANYGVQDGRAFDFISRTTPTGGADRSLVEQLLKIVSF